MARDCAQYLHLPFAYLLDNDRIMGGDVNAVYNPNLAQIDTHPPQGNQAPLTERDGFIVRENEADETGATEREEHLRLQNAIKEFVNSR